MSEEILIISEVESSNDPKVKITCYGPPKSLFPNIMVAYWQKSQVKKRII